MRVIDGLQTDVLPASAVTLGMFDGVHRGHQALLSACRAHAARLGVPSVALTYEPHPSRVLRPDQPVRLLTPLPEKLERMAHHGIDYVLIAEFTLEFSRLSPEQYLRSLVAALHPRVVVAGYRTTFGHHRAGSADVLRELGARLGFGVEIVEPILVEDGPVSSTRIRESLAAGEVELAAELLGYHYRLNGVVRHGDGRGQQLGIPTANLEVTAEKLIPADGVYAVQVTAPDVICRGVMNIGQRPTFDRPASLEVHLLDFQGDLYGTPITVTFLKRLRATRPFPTPEALLAQIHEDIAEARGLAMVQPS
jgi:riboflavin kinase/FMN adenylyltransferase